MEILTDVEIARAIDAGCLLPSEYKFARAIEATVLAKLAAKDVKPTAYMTYKGHLLHADDPKVLEHSNPEPLYTQAQLLAVQQRTAEACAELMESQHTWVTREAASAIVRNNWRKYL